ncbi:MAG: ABC transporter substrate-binding protein [Pseudoclavibacter sp.]
MKHARTAKRVAVTGVAMTSIALLAACGGGGGATVDGGELDLSPLQISADQEAELTALYDAAIESGNTEITVYAGHHDEFMEIYSQFEERFPGLTIVPETLVGAELQTALEAERDTGQHVVDVMSNPNADRYAEQGFAEEFAPPTYASPDWADGRIDADQYQDPAGFYHSPWALLFSAGYNTDLMTEADLPANWPDFADPEFADKVTFMTPSTPGGMQTVLSILLQSDLVDEEWLRTVASQSRIVAQDQLALQSISSGEYAIDLTSAATSIRKAIADGAPVDLHLLENPVVATEKWMLAANAPSSDGGKLFLSYLFSAEAQEQALVTGNFPLNPAEGLESPYGWPALEDIDFVHLPSQSTMREEIENNQDLFQEITAS